MYYIYITYMYMYKRVYLFFTGYLLADSICLCMYFLCTLHCS